MTFLKQQSIICSILSFVCFRRQCSELCVDVRDLSYNFDHNSNNHFMRKNNSWPPCFKSTHSLKKNKRRTMISVDFALLFVIFQRIFQLTSFTFVNPSF